MNHIFLWSRLQLFVQFWANFTFVNVSDDIILCIILSSRLKLWRDIILKANADITQMFSATYVGILYPNSNRQLQFLWKKSFFIYKLIFMQRSLSLYLVLKVFSFRTVFTVLLLIYDYFILLSLRYYSFCINADL